MHQIPRRSPRGSGGRVVRNLMGKSDGEASDQGPDEAKSHDYDSRCRLKFAHIRLLWLRGDCLAHYKLGMCLLQL